MSTSDSHWTQNFRSKLAAFRDKFREHARRFSAARWLILLAGIGCLAYGQYLMEQRDLQGPLIPIAEQWNATYQLELVNANNVLLALPLFFTGLLLCGWTGLPLSWRESLASWTTPGLTRAATKRNRYITGLLLAAALMTFLLLQLGNHRYSPTYPFLWLISLGLFTLTIYQWDHDHEINLSLECNTLDILWILALLTLGIGIGAYALQDIPAIMVPDEGSFWENARGFAAREFQPALFDSGVYTFPVVSTIFQGWILRIFGASVWSWRFSSVLAGVATVLPLYLLSKEWFGRRVAVASVLFLLANPYFLSFTRLGYNNSQSLLPVTLAIYFWALGSRKGSYFYLWLAGLTAGLGFYTYAAVWIGMLTICLGVLYLRVLKQLSGKQGLVVLALILLAWGSSFAPRLAYVASGEASHGLLYKIFETSFFNAFYGRAYYEDAELTQTMPFLERTGYPSIFYDPLIYGELLLRGVVRTVLSLFDPYLITEHFLLTALTGVIAPIFFAIGCALFLRRWKQTRFGLALIWLVVGLIFLSVIAAFPPRHTHMVSLIPVIALISAAGLSAVVERFAEYLPRRLAAFRATLVSLVVGTVVVVSLYFGANRYFVSMPQTFPPSFEDLAAWIAWRTEKPILLLYLGRTDVAHKVAYVVNTKMGPHFYLNLDPGMFPVASTLLPEISTVVFVELPSTEGIPYLQDPPEGYTSPVAFRNKAGEVLGYVMTNSPGIPVEWPYRTESALDSVWESPAGAVLSVLLIAFVSTGIVVLRRNRFVLPRLDFALYKRVESTAVDTSEELSHSVDSELSLRTGVVLHKDDRE